MRLQHIILLLLCGFFLINGKPRPKFETYKSYQKTNGVDHRPIHKTQETNLSNIRVFFEKKRIINILQNSDVSVIEKMNIIDTTLTERNVPKVANIFAGGLMSKWDEN